MMNIWQLTIIGAPVACILLLVAKLSMGHPIIPFGLLVMSLWYALIIAGMLRLPFALHEIYLLKNQEIQ
jgi:hypothetical protein